MGLGVETEWDQAVAEFSYVNSDKYELLRHWLSIDYYVKLAANIIFYIICLKTKGICEALITMKLMGNIDNFTHILYFFLKTLLGYLEQWFWAKKKSKLVWSIQGQKNRSFWDSFKLKLHGAGPFVSLINFLNPET